MLKQLLFGIARSNVLVDIALDLQKQLSQETRAAAIAIGVGGFGAGVFVASAVGLVASSASILTVGGLLTGGVVAGGGIYRAQIARQRLEHLRDLLTAKTARDAAASAVSAGADLVAQGLATAGASARAAFDRTVNRVFSDKRDPGAK